MSKVKVNLPGRSYDIIIGRGTLKEIKRFVVPLKLKKAVVITDTNVGPVYGNELCRILKGIKVSIITIPAGEKHKTLYTASAVYDQLINTSAHRDTLIIALGGGVIGDLAGFVAATYMRGLPLIQIPTTLLAQVDASIGGKTGVDHPKGKNLIGSFYQPKLVIVDTLFLKTLPAREIKTGLAEVVKYGIIQDARIFEMLTVCPRANSAFWEEIITRCVKIKAAVVSRDEKEISGLRMILNFGHTFGHAVETLTGYGKYTHGEAIAIGMAAAARLAKKLKLLKDTDCDRIINLLSELKLPVTTGLKAEQIIKTMLMDKKAKSGNVRFVLPVKIGAVVVRDNIPAKAVISALKDIGCK